MDKVFCVYMMTNAHNTVLYTGMTSDLKGRVWQHKTGVTGGVTGGFTSWYKLHKLVWHEVCPGADAAIHREKQIKGGNRAK